MNLHVNSISNIWKHPRTSAAGVLIAVATIAGVLTQHGVSLGTFGGGSAVSLAGALATALLGLVARDPNSPAGAQGAPAAPAASCGAGCGQPSSSSSPSSTSRLAVWMLIVLLLPLPWLEGCSGTSVAQDIVNWTPSLQSAVATVDSTAALLAPADLAVFSAATTGFDAASNLLAAQAKAYLASPTASALAQLQSQVVTFQQQVNAALLSAARISDSASQTHAIATIQAVSTIVTAILALVQTASSQAQVAQMAAHSTIKFAEVAPYLDQSQSAQIIAEHYDEPVSAAHAQIAQVERDEMAAGF